jgi:hypothetical protein
MGAGRRGVGCGGERRGERGESEFLSLFCNVLIPSLNAQQLISPVALYSKKDYLYQQSRKTSQRISQPLSKIRL